MSSPRRRGFLLVRKLTVFAAEYGSLGLHCMADIGDEKRNTTMAVRQSWARAPPQSLLTSESAIDGMDEEL